jgi:hypothetical protein
LPVGRRPKDINTLPLLSWGVAPGYDEKGLRPKDNQTPGREDFGHFPGLQANWQSNIRPSFLVNAVSSPPWDPASSIRVQVHPPERSRQGTATTLPCACCSCCCCCLHTVGGLVGGVVGSLRPLRSTPRPVDPDFPFPFRRDELDEESPILPVTLLYWMLTSTLLVAVAIWFYFDQGGNNPQNLVLGLLVGLMVFPLLQLGASLLTTLGVAIFYGDKLNSLRRVGHITLWSFVGALIGMVFIGGCCGLLYMAR